MKIVSGYAENENVTAVQKLYLIFKVVQIYSYFINFFPQEALLTACTVCICHDSVCSVSVGKNVMTCIPCLKSCVCILCKRTV